MNVSRDISIDVLKTLLVIGMITAHVYQLCTLPTLVMGVFSLYINWITFSGFLFVFGYLNYKIYLSKSLKDVKANLIRNCKKLLLYYYISAFSYVFLISKDINLFEIIKVLLFWRIGGYSEFLLSFFMVNLLLLLCFNYVKRCLNNKVCCSFFILFSLAATYIPYQFIHIPIIGTLIGTDRFACFPVLQYSSFYILGAICGKWQKKFNMKVFSYTFFLTLVGCIYVICSGVPTRFPPHLMWICLPQLIIYIYFIVSIKIEAFIPKGIISHFVYICGKHTIDYLLFSNLIIFFIRYFQGLQIIPKFSISVCLCISLLIISVITLFKSFSSKWSMII